MSTPTDPSMTRPASERAPTGEYPYAQLRAEVVTALRRQLSELATRWELQARSVTLLDQADGPERGEQGPAGDAARGLTDALISALATDDEEPEEAISHGFRFGSDSFDRGLSLHYTMKALDLLFTMTLYAVESELKGSDARGTAADGLRLTRPLQRRAALLSLAATRGYTQAYTEALRERFRHLRHDLRNPLGTIASVLALMDDETVPLDARANPNFRAMAKRNARTLETMIADRLSDAAALLPVVAEQDVSLRTIACAVRRELRGEAERRGVSVLIGSVAPHGHLDAPGLELLLHGALLAAIQESADGEQLHVEFGDGSVASEGIDGRATILLSCESGRAPIRDGALLERLVSLAKRLGASVDAGQQVVLSLSMRAMEPAPEAPRESARTGSDDRERAIPREPIGLGDGEAGHDVRSARQGHDGQPSAQ